MKNKLSLFEKSKIILSRKLINLYYLFIFVSIASVFVEVIGISSVPIFISVLLNENTNFILDLNKFFDIFGINILDTNREFKNYYFVFILVLIIFKFLFSISILFLEAKLAKDTHIHLKNKFFNHYIKLDYVDYVKYNIAHIQRNIEIESNTINGFFHAGVRTIKNIFLFIFFILVLSIANFKVTMVIFGILFLMIFTFFSIIKKLVKKNSEEMIYFKGKTTQWVLQAARSIIDIKFLNLEKKIANEFNKNIFRFESRSAINRIFGGLPSSLFELIGLIFIIVLIIFLYTNDLLNSFLPLITLYLISFARLLPSAIAISSSVVILRHGLVSLDYMLDEIGKKKYQQNEIKKTNTTVNFKNEITLDNVNFSYNHDKKIIKNFNYSIKKGSVISFTGGSGTGKSTILKLICGLLKPTSGRVLVDGKEISHNLFNWRSCIGYLSQNIYLIDDTIKNNITILEQNVDLNNYKSAIKNSNLEKFIDSLTHKDNTIIGDDASFVSGGQKQRIALARILYLNRELIVLDEFTNNLDKKTSNEIFHQILNNYKGKKTIIFATHDTELSKLSDENFSL